MKYIILSLSFIILFASCQKGTTTDNREDILRNGRWKIAAAQSHLVRSTGTEDHDLIAEALIPGCNQDDYFIFGPGYVGTLGDGGTKCTPGDPDGIQFTWAPTGNDAGIGIFGLPAVMQIQNANNGIFSYFNSSKFILKYSYTSQDTTIYALTDTAYYTYTFVHQ